MKEKGKKYSKVHFEPWVGDAYKTGLGICGFDKKDHIVYGTEDNPGVKVLVLGESHYCAKAEDDKPSLTNDIINDLLDPMSEHESYKNTYTKFIKSLSGHYNHLAWAEKTKVWQHVVFYNYVQEALDKPRQKPNHTQFANAHKPFFEVLEKNNPDIVIVWGSRLYNNLPQCGKQLLDLDLPLDLCGQNSIEIWAYEVNGKWIPIMPIRHPSAAYSYRKWGTIIRTFINNQIKNNEK